MNPKAIVFDLDGVLVDSAPLRLRATQLALGERGLSYTTTDSRAFENAIDADVLRVLRILFDLDAPTGTLVEAARSHLSRLIRAEGRLLPGVPSVPRYLRRHGARLGLLTSEARPVVRAALETADLVEVFDAIVSGEEIPRVKPAPDAFLMMARRLDLAPADCLVIEDSRSGVLAARAAGMPVAAVPGPATGHEDFTLADLVLPSLWALPKAIGWNGEAIEGMVDA
jgi:HAD superfamily hydrolase (TIGR01509 family)